MTYRARMRLDQIALQSWTVRRLMALDVPSTLQGVAAAGYRTMEVGGLPPIDPDALRRHLDAYGLKVVAAHEGIADIRMDPDATADRLEILGCPRLVVPYLPDEERLTHSDVRRFAAEVGALASRFADRGLDVGYHNHDFEFAPFDGTTIWDILLAELPETVDLELDVYWISLAGRDPVTEITAVADRVRSLHMKDRSAVEHPRDMPVGDGILPFADIVAAGDAAGIEWYVAELDDPEAGLDEIGRAYASLSTLV